MTAKHRFCAEIVSKVDLSIHERLLLDNHSLLNLFNVLERVLSRLIERTNSPTLKPFAGFCVDVLMRLSEPEISGQLEAVEDTFHKLAHSLKALLVEHPEEFGQVDVLLEILQVGISRVGEFREDRFEWRWISCDRIYCLVKDFLNVTQRHSRGQFTIQYPPDQPEASGYLVDFEITCRNGWIYMPTALHDTIRDLVANARKYAPRGTTITIALMMEPSDAIRLRVSDQGMGIPQQEIERVIEYGYRASNAQDRKTMGGGYGLTKAYVLAKRFNGQFWIESALNEGTTIEFTLLPPCAPGQPPV